MSVTIRITVIITLIVIVVALLLASLVPTDAGAGTDCTKIDNVFKIYRCEDTDNYIYLYQNSLFVIPKE